MQVGWKVHHLHVLVESLAEREAAQVVGKMHVVEALVEVLPERQVAQLRWELDVLQALVELPPENGVPVVKTGRDVAETGGATPFSQLLSSFPNHLQGPFTRPERPEAERPQLGP